MNIGKNALQFEDYVLSIQYFNQVIKIKPYLAEPYIYRGIAKISLGDYTGAEQDCTEAIERNPFVPQAYYARGFARKNINKFSRYIYNYCIYHIVFIQVLYKICFSYRIYRIGRGQIWGWVWLTSN